MIYATLATLPDLSSVHPGLNSAITALRAENWADRDAGRYELDGSRLVAIVNRYQTQADPAAEVWEAHRRFLDVQYLVSGAEAMGYARWERRPPTKMPYDDARDVEFFQSGSLRIPLAAGEVMIFFPHDVHAPGLVADPQVGPQPVVKVVVKVAIDWDSASTPPAR